MGHYTAHFVVMPVTGCTTLYIRICAVIDFISTYCIRYRELYSFTVAFIQRSSPRLPHNTTISIHFIPIIKTDYLVFCVQETFTICSGFYFLFCNSASTLAWFILRLIYTETLLCFLSSITFSVYKKAISSLWFLTSLIISCVTSQWNYIICPSIYSFHLSVICDLTVALGNIRFNNCRVFVLSLSPSLPHSPLVLSSLFIDIYSLTNCSHSVQSWKLLCRCMFPYQ